MWWFDRSDHLVFWDEVVTDIGVDILPRLRTCSISSRKYISGGALITRCRQVRGWGMNWPMFVYRDSRFQYVRVLVPRYY